MSRLPRRPSRPQPSQRGRSAAVPPLGQTVNSPSIPIVRPPPPRSSHSGKCDYINPDLLELYCRCPRLFRILNRPWKWLLVILVLMLLSFLLGILV